MSGKTGKSKNKIALYSCKLVYVENEDGSVSAKLSILQALTPKQCNINMYNYFNRISI